jgi:hypothetical protein
VRPRGAWSYDFMIRFRREVEIAVFLPQAPQSHPSQCACLSSAHPSHSSQPSSTSQHAFNLRIQPFPHDSNNSNGTLHPYCLALIPSMDTLSHINKRLTAETSGRSNVLFATSPSWNILTGRVLTLDLPLQQLCSTAVDC